MEKTYLIALLITFIAGLATLIGGFFTFFVKKDDMRFLAIGLGFSAGVMIYLSFTNLLPEAKFFLMNTYLPEKAAIIAFFAFFIGIIIAVLIDYFIPDHIDEDLLSPQRNCNKKHRIKRAGLVTAIAIAIHNFPEGMANFFVSSTSLTIGLPLAIAIAIHNIPEGIAVALPIYHATGKKRLAILYSFLTGIAEPIGAIIGFALFRNYLSETFLGYTFAIVAGIMIYISIDTLLPLAREYGDNHHVVIGIVSGMFVIGLSLIIL